MARKRGIPLWDFHIKKKKKKIGLNYIKNFLIEEQIGKSKLKTKLTSILASITTSVFQN